MKKLIPLLFGVMLPLAGAFADEFTDQAVEFCRSKGGNYSLGSQVEEGDKYCRQITCKKTNDKDGSFVVPEGATGPVANVEATKRVCLPKSQVDGVWTGQNTISTNTQSGAASGSASGSASGAASGSASGAASGSASGAASGSASGAASGSASGAGDGGAVICEELEGEGRIQPGGLCYNECKPRKSFLGIFGSTKSGFERKSCVECLLKYPGVYRVKREYLPRDSNGRVIGDNSVDLGRGVTVKTGVIVCKDSKGNIVSVNGTVCPTGSVVYTTSGSGSGNGTVVIAGGAVSGSGSGNGGVIIAGGAVAGAGAGGSVQLPAYCNSTKQKDIEKCNEWMQTNRRFLCSSSGNPSLCMGGYDVDVNGRYNVQDCVNCQAGGGRKQSTLSGIAEIVGAIAPPLAMFGSAYVGAKAYQRSNEAWAGAAAVGYEQCQISQNNYLQYLAANELPGLTPAQQAQMNCNGFGLGQYAGMQNGGLGGWYGAGYTPGFIGGMMGPYGGYNPYGMGGYVGGVAGGIAGGIGMAGGYVSGVAGGYVGGYPGGMAGGYVAGGYAGGYPGGMAGGYPGGIAGGLVNGVSIAGGFNGGMAGGYPGGIAGGYVAGGYAGGYPGGMAGGYAQGGYAGGYPGGIAGGLATGISIAGGINGGYAGGFQGGYAGGYAGGFQGGMAGGYAGGYMAGGMVGGGYAGGYLASGYNGGIAGGYAGGFQGGYAGGYAGGMAGGYNPGVDMQAANYDRMMQQQGTAYQMGMGSGAMGGGYGGAFGAGGYPLNAGVGIYGSFGGGLW